MTRRPGFRLETDKMRAEQLQEDADKQARQRLHDDCQTAVWRSMAAHINGARHCPIHACRRARTCSSDDFACLTLRRRPVLTLTDEYIAVQNLICAREAELKQP